MLQLTDIHKRFTADTPILEAIDLTVEAGEIACLLGPSGCGKTTLLRIVAGLEQADRGRILFDGQDLATVPVHQRNFGLMFQEFALFPHRSVGENIAFGLRMAGQASDAIQHRVDAMLDLVSLQGYANRSIFELSGGERQRVALARSLAPNPRLLMLDEPLGSLDRSLREDLMLELRVILKQVGVTALYVTHDQQEAYAVCDRLVVMQRGRIAQIGAPEAVYARPAVAFVARFLGLRNLLPGQISEQVPGQIETPVGRFELPAAADTTPGHHWLLLRPEALRIDSGDDLARVDLQDAADGNLLVLESTVARYSFRGESVRLETKLPGEGGPFTITLDVPNHSRADPSMRHRFQPGQVVRIVVDTSRVMLLPRSDKH